MAPDRPEAGGGAGMTGGGADELIMGVERDPQSGLWRVMGDDGSICEDGFASSGAARRYIEDRSDLSDHEVRSIVPRCSPGQRRELRRLLDEIEGGGGYGPT
jgi:hypothetical protein